MWKNAEKKDVAAQTLGLTADDLKKHGLVDEIIPEPRGGAHVDHTAMAETLKIYLLKYLAKFSDISTEELLRRRYEKFRRIGAFEEKVSRLTLSERAREMSRKMAELPLEKKPGEEISEQSPSERTDL